MLEARKYQNIIQEYTGFIPSQGNQEDQIYEKSSKNQIHNYAGQIQNMKAENSQQTSLKIENDPLINDDFQNYLKNGYQLDKPNNGSQQKLEFPPQNSTTNYYHEYCRLYIANVALTTQIKQLLKSKQDIKEKLDEYENSSFRDQQKFDKKKRSRRAAQEIERHYKCPSKSEGSLNQHLKLKHPEIYAELIEKLIQLNKEKEKDQEGSKIKELG